MNIDKLSLNDALRYFFCGAAFILAFARGADWDASDFKTLTGASVAGIGLIALTSGAIIYSIYRALIYVYTSRIAGCLSSMTTSWNERKISYWLPTHVPSAEFDEDKWRWTFGAENGKQDEAARGRLSEWGSQVHLCYTIALAIGMGSFFGVLAIGKCPSPDRFLILIAVFFFIAGFFSHLRLKSFESSLGKPKPSESGSCD